jgi:hypothetical protein
LWKLQVQVIQTWGGYYNVHGKLEKIVLLAAKQGGQIKGVHHRGHRQQLSLLPSLSKFHSPPGPSSSELSRCWAFQSGWQRSGLCAGVLGWPVKAISKVLPPRHSQFEQQLDSRQQGVPPLCAVHNAFQLLPHIALEMHRLSCSGSSLFPLCNTAAFPSALCLATSVASCDSQRCCSAAWHLTSDLHG